MSDDKVHSASERIRESHRPTLMGTNWMVSSGHPLASQAAAKILDKGGNAVDAGVAAGICISVVHTDMVNFAGVAPIMIHMAETDTIVTLDGLGWWPKKASVDFFMNKHQGKIPSGILTAVVPAGPASWIEALKNYGTLSFEEVTRDAIYLASHGFPMHPLMSTNIKNSLADYQRWPSTASVFLPDGRPPEPGDVFVQKELAATLGKMVEAEKQTKFMGRQKALSAARDEFYQGSISRRIVEYHQKHGGLLTQDDFASYRIRTETPPSVSYSDYTVFGCGPWSQGPVLLQSLQMIKNFDLKAFTPNSWEYIHLLTEVLKLAFADREKYIGDPEFVRVPLQGLLSEPYNKKRIEQIDWNKACPEMPAPGDPWPWEKQNREPGSTGSQNPQPNPAPGKYDHLDTSYVAVVDRYGNIFSAVPSDIPTNTPIIPGLGLAVSSRGVQSRVDPYHPASIEPGKRPRLTPNPVMIFRKGKPYMVIGTPGGDVQCQAVLQVLLNILEYGIEPQEAIEMPRFSTFSFPNSFAPHSYFPGMLRIENRYRNRSCKSLSEKDIV